MASPASKTNVILVMGPPGIGKSTFINKLATDANFDAGPGDDPCTRNFRHVGVNVDGTQVILVDTPRFEHTSAMNLIDGWLEARYAPETMILRIVYLRHISNDGLEGSSIEQLPILCQLCQIASFSNLIVVSAVWREVRDNGLSEIERREEVLNNSGVWKDLIGNGASLARFDGSRDSGLAVLRKFLNNVDNSWNIQRPMPDIDKGGTRNPMSIMTNAVVALAKVIRGAFWKTPGPREGFPESECFDGTQIIVVMGSTGTGKTTFINTLFPMANFEVEHGLKSCTRKIQHIRENLDGSEIILVDTPGFDGTYATDVYVLRCIEAWLSEHYKVGRRVLGIIYLHRISDNRIGGISSKQLQMFRRLCGEDGLSNVVMVSTMWENVSEDEGNGREAELCTSPELWKALIDKGAGLKRFTNDAKSAMEIVSRWLSN